MMMTIMNLVVVYKDGPRVDFYCIIAVIKVIFKHNQSIFIWRKSIFLKVFSMFILLWETVIMSIYICAALKSVALFTFRNYNLYVTWHVYNAFFAKF